MNQINDYVGQNKVFLIACGIAVIAGMLASGFETKTAPVKDTITNAPAGPVQMTPQERQQLSQRIGQDFPRRCSQIL